jgi:hypothetical protein
MTKALVMSQDSTGSSTPPQPTSTWLRPPVRLTLLNGSTPDINSTTPVTTILPNPPNPQYSYDVNMVAGGKNALGVLPMGAGRSDFPGQAYVSPLMVSAWTPAILNIQYKWNRTATQFDWYIVNTGTSWNVTQRGKTTGNDFSPAVLCYNTTPDPTTHEFYIYDNPGIAEYSGDLTKTKVNDYIYGEKAFVYTVQFSRDGGNTWYTAVTLNVNQNYTVKVVGTTGKAPSDWQGLNNTASLGAITPQVTKEKVQHIVGGNLPVNIDSGANN